EMATFTEDDGWWQISRCVNDSDIKAGGFGKGYLCCTAVNPYLCCAASFRRAEVTGDRVDPGGRRPGREVPLARVRHAAGRDHDQLHRPPGARRARAVP